MQCARINCQPCTSHLRKFIMVLTWLTEPIRIVPQRAYAECCSAIVRHPTNKCQSNLYLFDIRNYFVNFHYAHNSIMVALASLLSLLCGCGCPCGGAWSLPIVSMFELQFVRNTSPPTPTLTDLWPFYSPRKACWPGIFPMQWYLGGCCGRCTPD